MTDFKPRTTAPSKTDKNWIRWDKKGHNYCMEISNGNVMPNCTGYAWGRWRELLGGFHELSRGDAEVWWGKVSDGYKRGQTPKLAAIICWRKGVAGNPNDGAGHVAVVEDILSDGTIITSNSNYKGTNFYMETLKPPYLRKGLILQGFIYPPVDYVKEPAKPDPNPGKKTNEELAKEVLDGKWGNYPDRKKDLEAAGYDYDAVQAIVNGASKPKPTPPKPTPTKVRIKPGAKYVSKSSKYNGKPVPKAYINIPLNFERRSDVDKNWIYLTKLKSFVLDKDVEFI